MTGNKTYVECISKMLSSREKGVLEKNQVVEQQENTHNRIIIDFGYMYQIVLDAEEGSGATLEERQKR
jgi:hypothetical protein